MQIDSKELEKCLSDASFRALNMYNFLAENSDSQIHKYGDTYILRGVSDKNWVYIHSPDDFCLSEVMENLTPSDRCFAAVEDWLLPHLMKRGSVVKHIATIQLILPEIITLQAPNISKRYELKALEVSDAEIVYKKGNYEGHVSLGYIRNRIASGMSLGAWRDGELTAWGLTHDDRAIGFLYVDPEHRRRGLARAILVELSQAMRAKELIPFVHIEESNMISTKMALHIGFEPYRRLHWIELD